jgi:hypothetical protein
MAYLTVRGCVFTVCGHSEGRTHPISLTAASSRYTTILSTDAGSVTDGSCLHRGDSIDSQYRQSRAAAKLLLLSVSTLGAPYIHTAGGADIVGGAPAGTAPVKGYIRYSIV